jgi:hypothetical protein
VARKNKRARATGKGEGPSWVSFPHRLLTHRRFYSLSSHAVKLLCYLAGQYKGSNNGDLQATFVLAKKAGWRSKSNLHAATQELDKAGFIRITRQGGKNQCSLYALTWFAIDDCDGKHDHAPTHTAPYDFMRMEQIEIGAPPVDQSTPGVGQ